MVLDAAQVIQRDQRHATLSALAHMRTQWRTCFFIVFSRELQERNPHWRLDFFRHGAQMCTREVKAVFEASLQVRNSLPTYAKTESAIEDTGARHAALTIEQKNETAGKDLAASFRQITAKAEKLSLAQTLPQASGGLACPYCGLHGLSETGLHTHLPLYHSTQRNVGARCPLPNCQLDCSKSSRGGLYVHFHNSHGPAEARETPRLPGSYHAFAQVIVRDPVSGAVLLTHEPEGLGGGYYLPAGRVDPGEGLIAAAHREAQEEVGVHIRVTGLLKVEASHDVLRAVLLAEPVASPFPPARAVSQGIPSRVNDVVQQHRQYEKSVPDFESCGAVWVQAADFGLLNHEHFRTGRVPSCLSTCLTSTEPGPTVHSVESLPFQQLEAEVRFLASNATWDPATGHCYFPERVTRLCRLARDCKKHVITFNNTVAKF